MSIKSCHDFLGNSKIVGDKRAQIFNIPKMSQENPVHE